jgi:hypothetical protein
VTVLAPIHALLGHFIDYAGTFPPASLSLNDTVENYVSERDGPEAWLLGRLVVKADSLDAIESLVPKGGTGGYQLSVIAGADAPSQLARVAAFNDRRSDSVHIASIEFAPTPAAQISSLMRHIDSTVEAFFETPLDSDLRARLDAIAAAGAAAKVRTGGTSPAAIPSSAALADFLFQCAERRLPFKATAGLHHVIRSCYPLTYERDSSTAMMHGFLNLLAAAAAVAARAGANQSDIAAALDESSAQLLVETARLHDPGATRGFFRSFGSCSFREPVDELARMNLLEPT